MAYQAAVVETLLESFVRDALMGCMHIHHDQPVAILREDVDARELRERKAQRRQLVVRFQLGRDARQCLVARNRFAYRRRRRLRRQGHASLHAAGGANHADRRALVAARPGLAQRRFDGLRNHPVDPPAVPEADLVLCRVRVRVHRAGIHSQTQHVRRESAVEHHVTIRMAHRVGQRPVVHAAPVDDPELLVGLAAVVGRKTDMTFDSNPFGLQADRQRLLRKRLAEDPRDALQKCLVVSGCRELQNGTAIVRQRESYGRPGQREPPEPFFDVTELRTLGAQEATSRRRIEEQVAHFHRRTGRVRCGPRRRRLARLRRHLPRGLAASGAGHQ